MGVFHKQLPGTSPPYTDSPSPDPSTHQQQQWVSTSRESARAMARPSQSQVTPSPCTTPVPSRTAASLTPPETAESRSLPRSASARSSRDGMRVSPNSPSERRQTRSAPTTTPTASEATLPSSPLALPSSSRSSCSRSTKSSPPWPGSLNPPQSKTARGREGKENYIVAIVTPVENIQIPKAWQTKSPQTSCCQTVLVLCGAS